MRRVLSGVGRILITVGVLLLLFVAYQLWGTGIRQAQAQGDLKKSFAKELEAAGLAPINFDDPEVALGTVPVDTVPVDTVAVDTVAVDTVAVDTAAPVETTTLPASKAPVTKAPAITKPPATKPSATKPPSTAAPGPTVTTRQLAKIRPGRSKQQAPKPGRSLGLLVIKSIGVRQQLVEGTATEDLKTGPGHYLNTPYPGQPGNVAIAGHRTTYGNPFLNLNLVRVGDPIYVQTLQGAFRYDVIDACKGAADCKGNPWFVVGPKNSSVLVNTPDDNVLTLTTCHPAYTAKQRLIVRARLVGPAADADFFIPAEPPKTVPPKKVVAPTTVAAPLPFDTAIAPVTEAVGTEVSAETALPAEVSEPSDVTAEPTSLEGPRDPAGKGPVWTLGWLQGHRSTWFETLALAFVCALIWFGAWLLARKRRFGARALIYVVGFVMLFLPALYFTFEHLARLLPSNI